jgi:hypothetical protein
MFVLIAGPTSAKEKETKGRVDTQLRSYVDSTSGGKKYRNLVISVPVDDMIFRGALEDALADELNEDYVIAVQFTKLFPPTRSYSENEIKNVINDYGFSSILIISVTSDKMKEVGVASTTVAKTSGAASTSVFNMGIYGGNKGSVYSPTIGFASGSAKTTESSITRRLEGRNIALNAALYDVSTNKNVWIASLVSRIEEGTDKDSKKLLSEKKVAQNIADKISSALKSDKLLQEKRK